jgi:ATP phosphoribosyltransferase
MQASEALSPTALVDSSLLLHVCVPLQIPDVEVWFQRASDVVRKLRLGDIDLGIVGYDMFQEIGDEDR